MLVKFKSKAAADVLMLDRHAQKALAPFGKNTAMGYFSVGELDDAIGVLEATTVDGKHHAPTQALAQDVEFPAGRRIFEEKGTADRFWIIRDGDVCLELHVPGCPPAAV